MKTIVALFVVALILLSPVRAAEKVLSQTERAKVAKNLIANLSSENKGVRESSAFMLGELKIEEGVVPLMALLHNDPSESSRIVAALSLSKIGAARGTFAVKQAVRFDESKRVRLVCAWFANLYTHPQPFEIIPLEDAQEMQMAADQGQ